MVWILVGVVNVKFIMDMNGSKCMNYCVYLY